MKKILLSGLFAAGALALISPSLASAQTYDYQSSNFNNSSSAGCIYLTRYLELGSRDSYTNSQVTTLQQFLNRTGYLSGVNGYFDQGTHGAVVNYQREHRISLTGTVGPITRSAMNQQSCNGTNSVTNTYTGSNSNSYVSITSLSTTSGYSGSSVTIYGTNLGANNPIVHFGGSTVSASYATNNAITFTVPGVSSGTYQVYVSNANGSSNSITFTVTGQSGNNCYTAYNSNQCCNSTYNNTYSYTYAGSYTNNSACVNITGSASTFYGTGDQPRISNVLGTGTVSTGSSNTWSVLAYSQRSLAVTVTVDWGDGTSQQNGQTFSSSGQQQSYSFSHAYSNSGTYTLRFTATDSSGAYAYSTQQVSVYGNNGNYNYNNSAYTPNISYLSSTYGVRGSTIVLYGSNFSSNPTVMFGGSSYRVSSYNNGNSISFTLPHMSTGSYGLSVRNDGGQASNSLTFNLQ